MGDILTLYRYHYFSYIKNIAGYFKIIDIIQFSDIENMLDIVRFIR